MHIEALVEQLALELLQGTKIELVDVEYVKEREWYLRVFIDKEGGIEIEDCQNLSEKLERKLDALDPIQDSYYLEVSSPGLDRKLKKDRDFIRHQGDEVEVSTYAPLDGKKRFIGTLLGLEDDAVVLEADGAKMRFDRSKVAQVRLHMDF